jgi:hypothetical protein
MFSRRATWGVIVAAFAMLLGPCTASATDTTMRIANFGEREVECWIDNTLECRLPSKYECNFKVTPGKHIVEIIRPDNSGYRDSFSLPTQFKGRTYYRGEYLIGDTKVDYRLPLPESEQPPQASQ